MTDTKPLAWISADLSNSITARQVENIPELGCDPSQLYPIPLYPKAAVMTDNASIRPDMVRELRALAEKATPGPWKWFGNASSNHVYLATTHSGRRYVMDFVRWGMRGAQPRFQPAERGMIDAKDLLLFEVGDRSVVGVDAAKKDGSVYRYDVRGIDAPDAAYIAAVSPDVVLGLLELIATLEAEKEQWREAARCVVGADLPKYLRTLVAGWNGDGRPDGERFGRHPVTLGATIPTTCGAVYELDEALRCLAALTGIEVAPAPRNEV